MERTVKTNDIQNHLLKLGLSRACAYIGTQELCKIFGKKIDLFYDDFNLENKTTIVYLSQDRMRLFIHDVVIQSMGFKDIPFTKDKEKELGKFVFGSKNSMRYSFDARLRKTTLNGVIYWSIVGTSGSYGFGYGFLTKKETIGIRYRTQIYKQILEKYDWEKYLNKL
jgi:hypothetical protein